jgi:hypothetical protein
MSPVETLVTTTPAFLKEYRLHPTCAREPDAPRGAPGLRYATDSGGESVLVRTWPSLGERSDQQLKPFWQHELRVLRRVGRQASTSPLLAPMAHAVADREGFHLIHPIDSHRLLSDVWTFARESTLSAEDRAAAWRNLSRIAQALEALHGESVVHRNLDRWSILTAGEIRPDFRLTGFEWSWRITARADGTTAPRSETRDPFAEDWHAFARLAAEIVGLKSVQLMQPITPEQAAAHVTRSELDFLRMLETAVRVDPAWVHDTIDTIALRLELVASGREARLYLCLPLGEHNELTRAIQHASDPAIGIEEVEAQRAFVQADLSSDAVALAVPDEREEDGFELMLRGRQLNYRHIRDYRAPGGGDSQWKWAYCRRAGLAVLAPQPLDHQVRLNGLSTAAVTEDDPHSNRFALSAGAWASLRDRLRQPAFSDDSEDLSARGFLLNHIVLALTAAAEEFPVEVLPPSHHLTTRDDRYHLRVCARVDRQREALSEALQYPDPLGVRLANALLERTGSKVETWRLIEDSEDSEREPEEASQWEFVRQEITHSGHAYVFVGDEPPPRIRRALLVSADVLGTHKQLGRQMKAWRALRADQELLRTLTRPVRPTSDQDYTLVEDEKFAELDDAKKDALRSIAQSGSLSLVQGPPGVGKTHLIAELARQVLRQDPTVRMLFTAQSHAAVDHLLSGIRKVLSRPEGPLIVRCRAQDPQRKPGPFDVTQQTKKLAKGLLSSPLLMHAPEPMRKQVEVLASADDPLSGDRASAVSARVRTFAQRPLEALIIRSANLLFGTSNTAALERLVEEKVQFDWSVVEEAAKATGNELLNALLLSRRRLMIGDHQQLPPFNAELFQRVYDGPDAIRKLLDVADKVANRKFRGAEARALVREFRGRQADDPELQQLCGVARGRLQLFEDLIGARGETSQTCAAQRNCRFLSYQHRMHPAIARVVSHAFYDKKLLSAPRCEKYFATQASPVRFKPSLRVAEVPIVWIETAWDQETPGQPRSEFRPGPTNPSELQVVMNTVRQLEVIESDPERAPTLALLTPYRAQLRALQGRLDSADRTFREHLQRFRPVAGTYVHTVDSFQGNEADVVIVSLVRNNQRTSLKGALGFLADERRMNVLFSRAQWRLVIVGCHRLLTQVAARDYDDEEKTAAAFLTRLLEGVDREREGGNAACIPALQRRRRHRKKGRQ